MLGQHFSPSEVDCQRILLSSGLQCFILTLEHAPPLPPENLHHPSNAYDERHQLPNGEYGVETRDAVPDDCRLNTENQEDHNGEAKSGLQ